MRILWLLALALALPAHSADRTEAIKLRHVSAAELEAILLNSHLDRRRGASLDDPQVLPGRIDPATGQFYLPAGTGGLGGGFGGGGFGGAAAAPGGLLPQGIVALAANERQRTLFVAGTAEAIRQVRSMVRLLDIRPRQIRLSARLLELDPGAIRELVPGATALDRENAPAPQVAVADERQAAALTARARSLLTQVRVEGLNNRPLRLFLPARTAADPALATITPRVNGDGTITLFSAFARPGPAGSGKPNAGGTTHGAVIRRVSSGQTVAIVWPEGAALLVRAELLPEPEARPRR